MPRHALDPLQLGWSSKMPFCVEHIDTNWALVRAPVTVDVICGFGGTPPSHSVAGTGVSGSAATAAGADEPAADEAAVEAALVDEDVDPPHDDATHRRPPSAAERSAWLAEAPLSSNLTMSETYHTPGARASSVRAR